MTIREYTIITHLFSSVSLLIGKDSSKILFSRWWSAEWKLVSPWKHVEGENEREEKKGEDRVRHWPVETTIKRYSMPVPFYGQDAQTVATIYEQ